MSYALFADFAFSVPVFLIERLLRRDAQDMIGRLQIEIGTRATRVADRADLEPADAALRPRR